MNSSFKASVNNIFRAVLVTAAWAEIIQPLYLGISLFAPNLYKPIYASAVLQELLVTLVYFALAWAVLLPPAKRSLTAVGWIRGQMFRSLALGSLIGDAVYLCYVGGVWLGGWYRIVGHYAWSNVPLALIVSLLIALREETVFLGYLFRHLEQRQGTRCALLVSSVVFGAMHLVGSDPISACRTGHGAQYGFAAVNTLISTGTLGMLCAAAYLLNRSLWTAVGVHWAMDWFRLMFTYRVGGSRVSSFFRVTSYDPAFSLYGDAFWTYIVIVCVIIGLLLSLAKRRGQWQERPLPETQP